MTPPESLQETELRRRRNALEAVSDAAHTARALGATDGDIARAAFWAWEGDEVVQTVGRPHRVWWRSPAGRPRDYLHALPIPYGHGRVTTLTGGPDCALAGAVTHYGIILADGPEGVMIRADDGGIHRIPVEALTGDGS